MSKHILFKDGILASRYDSEIHGDDIPEGTIEVSEDLFWLTVQDTDGTWTMKPNGVITKVPFPAPTTAQLKLVRLVAINVAFEDAMSPIITGIPAIERESWKKQETEARSYLISNDAITPLIDALAISRGIDKAELVSRIITKADLFATLSGQLIGKRQALEDALDALPTTATAEEIAAITW